MQPLRPECLLSLSIVVTACAGGQVSSSAPAAAASAGPAQAPRFDPDGALAPPVDYRSWVFLTSGFSMSYGPAAQAAAEGGVDLFDNVFVTPVAYRGFAATGVWPEGTMFVLEIRTAEVTGSIVTHGRYQTDLVAIEAAVKDTARFPDGWGYFPPGASPAQRGPDLRRDRDVRGGDPPLPGVGQRLR
jgi:hypothetical protein